MVSPDFTGVNYRPSGASNGYQTFHLYQPSGVKPAAGWPVVVFLNHSGWTASTKASTVTSGVKLRLLHGGIAVCDATATVVDTGDPSITGGGMFWDPTDPGWATDDTPEHDLIWIVQKLRDLASTYEINANKVGLYCTTGSSSTIGANVCFSQDAAAPGAPTTQEQQSSAIQCAVLREFLGYYPSVLSTFNPVRLRDSATPSAQAATVANATGLHQLQASPLYRLAQSTASGTDVGDVPYYLRSVGSPGSTDFSLSSQGVPAVQDTIANDTNAWGQFIVGRYLRKFVGRVRQNRKTRHSANSDLYDEGADFNIPTGTEEELYAQRFLFAELAGKGGVLTFSLPCIGWSYGVDTSRRGASTSQSSPALVRRQTRSSHMRSTGKAKTRSWALNWPNATKTDAANLELIATVSHGPVLPMNFAPPDEPGTTLVRIARDTFRISQENAVRYSISLELEEVA